jgi:hypothetical protein
VQRQGRFVPLSGYPGKELTGPHDTIVRNVWYIPLSCMSKPGATKKGKANLPLSKSSDLRKANKSFVSGGSSKKRSATREKKAALPDTSAIPWLRTGTS